jgi:hypothetical protein
MTTKLMLKLIPAALTLALAGTAVQAQEATSDNWMSDFRSQRTRAEVVAEVMRPLTASEYEALVAEAFGLMPILRSGSVTIRLVDAKTGEVIEVIESQSITRAQVQDELRAAQASGEFARLNAEAFDFQAPAGKPAATVVAARR